MTAMPQANVAALRPPGENWRWLGASPLVGQMVTVYLDPPYNLEVEGLANVLELVRDDWYYGWLCVVRFTHLGLGDCIQERWIALQNTVPEVLKQRL